MQQVFRSLWDKGNILFLSNHNTRNIDKKEKGQKDLLPMFRVSTVTLKNTITTMKLKYPP